MSSSLRMVEAKLPPGFRFHPKDEELICDYLMKKMTSSELIPPFLLQVDLNKCEPWDLPENACVGGKEWYFYSQRDRKYATGLRTNRATVSGYWKATGKDRAVIRPKGTLVGMRKTLVFYQGRAPKGRKTQWVMHEFRLEGPLGPPKTSSSKEDWVLCRVFYKSREMEAKQSIESNSGNNNTNTNNEEASSSSISHHLPALMDSYINFDQTEPNLILNGQQQQQQVPCFSIFTSPNKNNNNDDVPPTFTHYTHNNVFMESPRQMEPDYLLPNCDMKIKAFLHHLSSRLDTSTTTTTALINPNNNNGTSPSFGEASPESFLSEAAGLSTMWNNNS